MKLNQKCGRPRGDAGLDDFSPGALLSDELGALLAEGFTTIEGAIVFKAMRHTAKRVKPKNFPILLDSNVSSIKYMLRIIFTEPYLIKRLF
jgi:hypothetical protein